jgi:hypothetical protein
LPGFIDFLEQAGAQHITTDLAVAWARLPVDALRKTPAVVRGDIGTTCHAFLIDSRTREGQSGAPVILLVGLVGAKRCFAVAEYPHAHDLVLIDIEEGCEAGRVGG